MLEHLKNKRQAFRSFSFEDELKRIVEANKEKLADLQASQLAKGVNSKGEDINPQYAPFTIAYKKQFGVGLGRVTDHVTYYQTGELYRSLFTQITGEKFSIKSESFKFGKMIQRSGQNVVGLDIESRREFVMEVTRPGILEVYKRKVMDV